MSLTRDFCDEALNLLRLLDKFPLFFVLMLELFDLFDSKLVLAYGVIYFHRLIITFFSNLEILS